MSSYIGSVESSYSEIKLDLSNNLIDGGYLSNDAFIEEEIKLNKMSQIPIDGLISQLGLNEIQNSEISLFLLDAHPNDIKSVINIAADPSCISKNAIIQLSSFTLFLHPKENAKGEKTLDIHLMKQSGKGKFKQNYKSLSINDKKFKSVSVQSLGNAYLKNTVSSEIDMHKKVSDVKGCVSPKEIVYLDDDVIFVSPFCDRGTIEKKFETDIYLTPQRMLDESLQLADIVKKLHTEKKIIHCDIKHDNVMYKTHRKTGKERIKLIDFGVSKEMSSSGIVGTFSGPQDHFPPEGIKLSYLILQLTKLKEDAKDPNNESNLSNIKIEIKRITKKIQKEKTRIDYSLDVWMLGLLMYKRLHFGIAPKDIEEFKIDLMTAAKDKDQTLAVYSKTLSTLQSKTSLYAKPTNPYEILIWEMLQLNPKKRPTITEVQKRLLHLQAGKSTSRIKMRVGKIWKNLKTFPSR